MKNPLIVNMFAGPGTGKSTTAAAVFSLLKLHNIEVELISEYPKDLIWEERDYTFKNQKYVFSKQQHRQWRVSQKVDIAVSDSPLLLSLIYGKNKSNSFEKYVLEEFNSFRNLNIFLQRVKPYKEYGRNETEEEAKKIDELIWDTLNNLGMRFMIIKADFDAPNIITEEILDLQFDKKLEYMIRPIMVE